MKTLAIIGSNSFSGSHCVNYFLKHTDYKIIGISRSAEKSPVFLPYLYKQKKSPRFRFYKFDLNKDVNKIIKLFDKEKPNIVINFSAQSIVEVSWERPLDWFITNCLGVVNLANQLKDKKYLKKYIHASTPEVYGSYSGSETLTYFNPSTPYAASKAAGDLFLMTLYKKFNFPVVFVRSANVYGPHQQLFKIIPKAVILIKRGEKIPLHQGGLIDRSFIHIEDVMMGYHKIIAKSKPGDVYHFSTGKNITIKELVFIICKKMKVDFNKSVEISEGRPAQDATYTLNIKNTSRRLNWKPKIKLEEGITQVIEWINDSWSSIKNTPLKYVHKK